MADPLGIVGVIGVALQIIKSAHDFGLDWKDAPADAKKFADEVQALKSVLSETNTNLLLSEDFQDAFHGRQSALLSQLGDCAGDTNTMAMLSTCRTELDNLLKDLNKLATCHRKLSWERLRGAFQAKKTREAVENLHRQCQTLNGLMLADIASLSVSIHKEVKDVRRELKSWRADGHGKEVLDWLSIVNYGPEQSDFIGRRQDGTGQWLLDSKDYLAWTGNTNRTLFCPGIPGAGKTILTSIVVDDLYKRFKNDRHVGIAYVYCDYRKTREQKASDLLLSLLKQLCQHWPSLPESVEVLYSKHKEGQTRPSMNEVSSCLQPVASLFSKVFIVIDALDELPGGYDHRATFLTEVFELQDTCGINVFATSRYIPDITDRFARDNSTSAWVRARDEDVRRYLDSRISQCGRELMDSHREEVKDMITKAVQGMFLLAKLYFNWVSSKTTLRKMRDALKNLPTGSTSCDDAYDQIMERIADSGADSGNLAIQVLSWVINAKEILDTRQLQQALAVEIGDSELDQDNLPQIEDMVSSCMGLVAVHPWDDSISLVHYTAQEYFQRTKHRWFPSAEVDIARTSVAYLSFKTFNGGYDSRNEYDIRAKNPFFGYAAYHWVDHVLSASQEVDELVSALLSSESKIPSSSMLRAMESKDYSTVDWLLKWHTDVNIRDRDWNTLLHMAVSNRSAKYVKLLLDRGAEITGNIYNMTPFHYAVGDAGPEIVQVFLDAGVSVDTRVKRRIWKESEQDRLSYVPEEDLDPILGQQNDAPQGLTGLHYAALVGDFAMVKFLLEHGADPNATSEFGETPLHLTLKPGIRERSGSATNKRDRWEDYDVRIEDGSLRNTWSQEEDVPDDHELQELYDDFEDNEPDVDEYYERLAERFPEIRRHREGVLDSLLEHPAINIAAKDTRGASPLHLACGADDSYAVRTLIKHGANAMEQDDDGCNMLHRVAGYRYKDAILALLDASIYTKEDLPAQLAKSRDKRGRNALHHLLESAFSCGVDMDLVQSLLANGAGVNDLDDDGHSPLSTFLVHSRWGGTGDADLVQMVQLLLQSGADPAFTTTDGGLGLGHLCAMARRPSSELLSILETFGVDLRQRDPKGRTILHHAARGQVMTEDEMDLLCRRTGLSKEAHDSVGKTPLDYMAKTREYVKKDPFDGLLGVGWPDK